MQYYHTARGGRAPAADFLFGVPVFIEIRIHVPIMRKGAHKNAPKRPKVAPWAPKGGKWTPNGAKRGPKWKEMAPQIALL